MNFRGFNCIIRSSHGVNPVHAALRSQRQTINAGLRTFVISLSTNNISINQQNANNINTSYNLSAALGLNLNSISCNNDINNVNESAFSLSSTIAENQGLGSGFLVLFDNIANLGEDF